MSTTLTGRLVWLQQPGERGPWQYVYTQATDEQAIASSPEKLLFAGSVEEALGQLRHEFPARTPGLTRVLCQQNDRHAREFSGDTETTSVTRLYVAGFDFCDAQTTEDITQAAINCWPHTVYCRGARYGLSYSTPGGELRVCERPQRFGRHYTGGFFTVKLVKATSPRPPSQRLKANDVSCVCARLLGYGSDALNLYGYTRISTDCDEKSWSQAMRFLRIAVSHYEWLYGPKSILRCSEFQEFLVKWKKHVGDTLKHIRQFKQMGTRNWRRGSYENQEDWATFHWLTAMAERKPLKPWNGKNHPKIRLAVPTFTLGTVTDEVNSIWQGTPQLERAKLSPPCGPYIPCYTDSKPPTSGNSE